MRAHQLSKSPVEKVCAAQNRPRSLGAGFLLGNCLTVLLVCVLPATPAAATDDWHVLATDHFTILSATDEATARIVLRNLEELRALLVQQLQNVSIDDPVETMIYLYPDADSFAPFAIGGGSVFFVPHSHANFAALVATDAGTATAVVYRQYVNHLVHREMPQVPLWMRHGLAELLSSFFFDGTSATIGAPVERDPTLLGPSSLALEELVAIETMPIRPERAEAFLRTSWGLVHFLLVEDAERAERTGQWVEELATDESASDRFLSYLGGSLSELDRALQSYLAREELPQRQIVVEAWVSEGSYDALSPHDGLIVQADLLLHTQPTEIARIESLLAEAFELEPASPIATAGEGLLKQQAGEIAAARDLYELALATLSQTDWSRHRDGFRLRFYYGDAELELIGAERPDTPEGEERLAKAIQAFQTCTELRPMFGEAWARLGYAHSLSPTSTAEAVPALERAYELLPAREDVAMNLLLAYARTSGCSAPTTRRRPHLRCGAAS